MKLDKNLKFELCFWSINNFCELLFYDHQFVKCTSMIYVKISFFKFDNFKKLSYFLCQKKLLSLNHSINLETLYTKFKKRVLFFGKFRVGKVPIMVMELNNFIIWLKYKMMWILS
jgi:hypothetical protein